MADKGRGPSSGDAPDRGGRRVDLASVTLTVSKLPRSGAAIAFAASAAERAAFAQRTGILALDRFAGDLLAEPWQSEGVKVTGRIFADVVQASVVTLDPLAQTVAEEIDLVFVPEPSRLARLPEPGAGEIHLDPEGDDLPETFAGDRIDLGEVLSEILALSLDPYPREAGAVFGEIDTDPDPSGGIVSPFDALRRLKP